MMDPRLAELNVRLQPLAQTFLDACRDAGLDVRITCAYRSFDEQRATFAKGRAFDAGSGAWTVADPRKVVTRAMPGRSWHNYRLAFDAAPFVDGRPQWSAHGLFATMGAIAEACGLTWGGRWATFPDASHFEARFGLRLLDVIAEGVPTALGARLAHSPDATW